MGMTLALYPPDIAVDSATVAAAALGTRLEAGMLLNLELVLAFALALGLLVRHQLWVAPRSQAEKMVEAVKPLLCLPMLLLVAPHGAFHRQSTILGSRQRPSSRQSDAALHHCHHTLYTQDSDPIVLELGGGQPFRCGHEGPCSKSHILC